MSAAFEEAMKFLQRLPYSDAELLVEEMQKKSEHGLKASIKERPFGAGWSMIIVASGEMPYRITVENL